jgi:diaminohydroxyphosphoribosylaminopyrimidine deaminase/5-amino-6-(5-phosphoribosylamino)uracil reductase
MNDTEYLLQALELAKQRRGFCAPNPAVGAVLVKNGDVIGSGYNWAAGHPHAEVMALQSLGASAMGATLYVSLEPCCHFGRTPPCTDLILKSGIRKVIYGFKDPNPVVAGQGQQRLIEGGVDCQYLALPEITDFYRSYAFWWKTRRPWVTAKLAMTLNGVIAGTQGEPLKITGLAAQQFTHECRRSADALLTTARSILADDPLLNVRLGDEPYGKPLYVLDSELSLPLSAKVWQTATKITVFHDKKASSERQKALTEKGAICVAVPSARENTGLDLDAVLHRIGEEGVHDLLVEAGGQCFTGFLRAGLVQRALVYLAPKILAGQGLSIASVDDLLAGAKSHHWQIVGDDAVCELLFYDKMDSY